MKTAQVMPGAYRGSIVPPVVAAARAEENVMIVKISPRAAARHGTAPAIAREDGIPVTRLFRPFATHLVEKPLEPSPPSLHRKPRRPYSE
jgi:hypothetical protein